MQKKIKSALISVFYKDGLERIVKLLQQSGVAIYSTGGTEKFIRDLGADCIAVESLTGYPSILGGRVKTLHPVVFGGVLGRRNREEDISQMKQYNIPEIDLVIVDLYPFEETLAAVTKDSDMIGALEGAEDIIIEKIDIGGPSMIRAAAKNFKDVLVVAAKEDYKNLEIILAEQNAETTIEQRKQFAAKAFEVVMNYDTAISNYFTGKLLTPADLQGEQQYLRYGENPHQKAFFQGDLKAAFQQLHGKELSYNNLVDADAAIDLMNEFRTANEVVFAIIKHTNVCGIAARPIVYEAWKDALAGDPESAFGGVLITNSVVDMSTASAINEIFFEVLIADEFEPEALELLQKKKNRILLKFNNSYKPAKQIKSVINGLLNQDRDEQNFTEWNEVGGRQTTPREKQDLEFANIVCKHLKSNAIALVKNKQLTGKGCGQTSRIDALKQAVTKAKQFHVELKGAVLASDAFFPFNDCVQIAHEEGIEAFIQPGGSIRDKDSIDYCVENNLAMVLTGIRHFKH